MHRYDNENERGWERGRSGRRDFEGRREDNYPDYEMSESWRGYEGRGQEGRDRFDRRYDNRGNENRGYENQGYGDQGAWGQPYADEYRSQDWTRQLGRDNFGRQNYGREAFAREYGGIGGREFSGNYGPQQSGMRGRFSGRGPKGYQRSDQRIQEEINDRLTDHPEIDAYEIEVKVNGGEVTLTGFVNERFAKRLAEDCVESVGGVKQVHNQIRVQQESGTGPQQRKTAGSENQQQHEMTGTTGSRR
jgi:osmotically-inducible protein OsmY